MTDHSPSQRSLWPWAITGGLTVVVLVNFGMLAIALDHPSVPASPDHYREALEWDDYVSARSAARERGWRVTVETHPSGSAHTVTVQVLDTDDRLVEGVTGRVAVRRSDSPAFDRQAPLTRDREAYRANLDLAVPGLYDVVIDLQRGDLRWSERTRLWMQRPAA